MPDIGLELGAQTVAAGKVAARALDAQRIIETLIDDVVQVGSGFSGGTAAEEVARALTGWVKAARNLPPALTAYAQALAGVDSDMSATEVAAVEGLGRAGQKEPR